MAADRLDAVPADGHRQAALLPEAEPAAVLRDAVETVRD